MSSPEEELTPILEQMSAFHLKWVALIDKCKALQSSLTEANCKNEELEIKLAQSLAKTTKTEEENKELIAIVKKLRRKLQTGSVHKLIDALKQNIRAYDETVLPSISELTKNIKSNRDDSDISNSDDENDLELLSLRKITTASKLVEKCVNQVQDSPFKIAVRSNYNEEVTKNAPTLLNAVPKNVLISTASLVGTIPPIAQNIEPITTADTNCDSKISSSCVILSSANGEKHSPAIVIPKSSSCTDKRISSTSSQSNNVSTTNGVGTNLIAAQINSISGLLENAVQPCFINESNIDSLCIVEEQIIENGSGFPANTDSLDESSVPENNGFSSNQQVVIEETINEENYEEKPDVLVFLPPMVVSEVSKDDDISCGIIDVDARQILNSNLKQDALKNSYLIENNFSNSETNQPERLKRPCSSPSSIFESSPKRSTIEKSFPPSLKLHRSSSRNANTYLKCMICEYEDINGDSDSAYETYLALDDHIIEKHPDPSPSYIRCMFNSGQCRRHFHSRQNFHKHVKRVHSLENPDFKLETNQRKPLKCTFCDKLFLFQSDLVNHNTRFHDTPSKKKIFQKVCGKKPTEHSQSTGVRTMAECEVCKKDNRPSVQYKLYDELDAHISKCHSDPFPDYFRCPYCKRHFKNVKWITSHIMKKHSDKYSKSPLEKFLPVEMPEDGNESMTTNDADELSNGSRTIPKELCTLRILSPSSINKAISSAIQSFSSSRPS